MVYKQRLRRGPSADLRVLKSQLDLAAAVIQSARYLNPLWAVAFAVVGSSVVGFFGHRSPLAAAVLPGLVSLMMVFSCEAIGAYREDRAAADDPPRLWVWFCRFVFLQAAISTVWSILPWLLWEPGNPLNHMFVCASVICLLAGFVVSRANDRDMLMASTVPLLVLSMWRFASAGGAFEFGLAILLPVCTLLLLLDGRRMTERMEQDSRLRFQVEDLARELQQARDQALHKRFEAEAANASKTAFLANMSHELRTPLNAILGFSEIIGRQVFGAAGSPRYLEYASDIHASGRHLLSLINDLLDVAKIEAGRMELEPQLLDPRATFEAALKLVGAKARKRGQELSIEIDASAPCLVADERALKQILLNLVSNAVKFTPPGGRIAVRASRGPGGGFQILVEDNGPGIPAEKLETIFMPFTQVNNRYDRQAGGTGLGLALVRGLVELHGGDVWIESDTGRGCCVYVVLPPAAEREPVETAA
ncbi:MAG TPA: HAMP domain-containing sensor histidine kinase [Rhizomicrobium sp.]|nr:HAMP domain-containing sensor histidine kinase [Rhizomicrobium sp.]